MFRVGASLNEVVCESVQDCIMAYSESAALDISRLRKGIVLPFYRRCTDAIEYRSQYKYFTYNSSDVFVFKDKFDDSLAKYREILWKS